MNRNDRLLAVILALQQRQETASSLANKFEVSRRTIIRDMQTLSEMGVPLYSTTGPSGGYQLMEGYHLPALQLEPQEALSLFFAVKAIQGYADTPFNSERWTVLDKIRNILPVETLNKVLPLLDHLEIEVPKRVYHVPLLKELLAYLADGGTCLNVQYRSLTAHRPVILRPIRVYAANGFWYCEAYSYTHGENRLFRVDRMETMSSCEPPEESSTVDEPSSERSNSSSNSIGIMNPGPPHADPPFQVLARLTYRGMLQIERDVHIGENIKQTSEDEWELDCILPRAEWNWAVRIFQSLGLDAEVLEPQELRDELRVMAEKLLAVYTQNVSK